MMLSTFKFFNINRKAWMFSGLMAAFILSPISSADAQRDRDMRGQVEQMQEEIRTLSRAVYQNGGAPQAGGVSSSGGDAEIRMQQLEGEMQSLRGTIERQSFEIRELKADLERVTSDLELRVNDLEARKNEGASSSGASRDSSSSSKSSGSSIFSKITPEAEKDKSETYAGSRSSSKDKDGYKWETGNKSEQKLGAYSQSGSSNADTVSTKYDKAFAMVKSNRYAEAQGEFENFLEVYPEHALAGNAKYWLGETHYVRGDFTTAARVFAEGYKKYPKGSKANDNLLKLGLSLESLGKKDNACVALRQLKKESQASGGVTLRRAEQEISRIGC